MQKEKNTNGWGLDFSFPLQGRCAKPRQIGLTMILDKGIGLRETQDLLEMCAAYIDYWKLGFGTSVLYEPALLKKKIELIHSFHIRVYPGGTFTEVAFAQGKLAPFLNKTRELGFTTLEVSEGTIELSPKQRSSIIKSARAEGLIVLTEIGKKEAGVFFDPEQVAAQIKRDLEEGAAKVILEARESGKNVTFFNTQGDIEQEKVDELLFKTATLHEQIIWEAPLKKQQVNFITLLGPNVSLGNIATNEVLALETLRTGMRADTFKLSLPQNNKQYREVPASG
ncbi:MAG: phosphosulfolactate synthase [Dethiobacteria bacterium]